MVTRYPSLLEQGELLLVSAAVYAAGLALLYFALGLWGQIIDLMCRLIGIHGAVFDVIWNMTRQKGRWWRVATWYGRTFRGEGR